MNNNEIRCSMKKLHIALITTQIIYYLTLPLWLLIWIILFIGQYYNADVLEISIFVLTTLYPVAVIGCSLFAWSLSKKNKTKASIIVGMIPFLFIVCFFLIAQFS